MKKIIIAAAAMALAVVANAASINWKVSGDSSQVGYTAYVLVGDVVSSWESADAVKAAAIDSGAIAKSGRVYSVNGTATNDSITKTSSFYYVIINADESQFAVSGSYSGATYAYDLTATPPETAPADAPLFEASGATFANWATTEPDQPDTPGDVPEPTSGLLLVLGVAGLALRRRRA